MEKGKIMSNFEKKEYPLDGLRFESTDDLNHTTQLKLE
jgi:hypothetical protein